MTDLPPDYPPEYENKVHGHGLIVGVGVSAYWGTVVRVFAYVLAAHAFAFGFGATANAADMFSMEDDACGSWKDGPCEKPALWSGAYIGIFAGGGSGDADITDVFEYDADPTAKNSVSLSPLIAGVNVGYNKQNGNFVYGLEAALGTMNFSDSVLVDDLEPGGAVRPIGARYSISGNIYGELTGRVGYARENYLLYMKGGAAFVNVDFDAHYEGELPYTSEKSKYDFSHSETMLGWTLGFGAEYMLSNALSVKLEYQHFDFGDLSYAYGGGHDFCNSYWCGTAYLDGDVNTDVTLDVVKLGINYKLQDEYDALK